MLYACPIAFSASGDTLYLAFAVCIHVVSEENLSIFGTSFSSTSCVNGGFATLSAFVKFFPLAEFPSSSSAVILRSWRRLYRRQYVISAPRFCGSVFKIENSEVIEVSDSVSRIVVNSDCHSDLWNTTTLFCASTGLYTSIIESKSMYFDLK